MGAGRRTAISEPAPCASWRGVVRPAVPCRAAAGPAAPRAPLLPALRFPRAAAEARGRGLHALPEDAAASQHAAERWRIPRGRARFSRNCVPHIQSRCFQFYYKLCKAENPHLIFFFLLSFSCSVPNTARAAALASSAAAAHDAVRSSAGSWRSPQRPPGGRAERGHGALRARAARRGAALPLARSSEGPSAPPRAEPEERPRHRERPRRAPPAPPEGAADIRRVGRAGGGISCAGGQPRPGPRCCRPAPLCPRPPGRSSRLGLTQ